MYPTTYPLLNENIVLGQNERKIIIVGGNKEFTTFYIF